MCQLQQFAPRLPTHRLCESLVPPPHALKANFIPAPCTASQPSDAVNTRELQSHATHASSDCTTCQTASGLKAALSNARPEHKSQSSRIGSQPPMLQPHLPSYCSSQCICASPEHQQLPCGRNAARAMHSREADSLCVHETLRGRGPWESCLQGQTPHWLPIRRLA